MSEFEAESSDQEAPEAPAAVRTGVDEVAIENFEVEAPPGWEPVLNEEHDSYRWMTRAEAIAIAHWPETADLLAALGLRPTSS